MEQGAKSALDSAHDRFVESLAQRAQELRVAVSALEAAPASPLAHEELRRRLHALLANAQSFEDAALTEHVERVTARFDAARDQGAHPALTPDDFRVLQGLLTRLESDETLDPPRVAPSGFHKIVHVGVEPDARALNDPGTAGGTGAGLSPSDPELLALLTPDAVDLHGSRSLRAPDQRELHSQTEVGPWQTGADRQELLSQGGFEAMVVPGAVDPRVSSSASPLVPLILPSDLPDLPSPAAADQQVLLSQTVADPQVLLSQTVPDPQVLLSQTAADPQVLLSQTVPGLLSSPVLGARTRMLLVCSRPHALRFRDLLEGSALDVAHAADAEAAIRLLHSSAPAFALLSAEFANLPDIDLIRRMQTDPLSRLHGVYVVLPEGASYDAGFLQQTGADGVLLEPLSAERLIALAEQSAQRMRGGTRALQTLTGGTVDEIASHVAEEIRRGIADSLRAGQHERIGLGDSHELMSAAWSAIGRVRSHLAEQSRGRVRFRDETARELPSFLTAEPRHVEPGAAHVLAGKRVLVADDDPAVLWFFSGLLRESSALVLQAQNGREALELARRKQPHLVLSDILMPKVDGFALCRELKRDALLSHVPVILLSWKDDFLERMRELDAGANAYLRKEAGSREILATISQVLQPRHELALALRSQDEVSGRLEGLGIVALLDTLAAERPDARLSVQDAWSLFEVELRSGQRSSVTRTAADGSFVRGERALLQLVGVNGGRFCINPSSTSLRSPLSEPLGNALQTVGKALAALLDAVSDMRLVHVALLAFDDDVVDLLLSCTPTRLHEVVARFRSGGATAKDLLFEGSFTPGELEGHLRELARHAAINGVWNAEGDDLVAAARRERDEQPGTLLHSSSPPGGGTAWFSSVRPSPAANAVSEAVFDREAGEDSLPSDDAVGSESWDTSEQTDPDGSTAARAATLLESAAPATPAPRSNEASEGVRLLFTVAALVVIGYFGWQKLEPYTRLGAHRPVVVAAAPAASPPVVGAIRQPDPAAAPAHSTLETSVQSGSDPGLSLGRILPYIDQGRGVAVGPEQGLLIVEYAGASPLPNIRIGGRELGRPPIAVALDAGRHELVVHQNREASFRYLIVRAGETRIISLPL